MLRRACNVRLAGTVAVPYRGVRVAPRAPDARPSPVRPVSASPALVSRPPPPGLRVRPAASYSTGNKLEVQDTPAMTRMQRPYPTRTHACGELRATHVAQRVALQGWVQHCRHLGSFLFIVLRDGAGTVQLVVDEADKDRFLKASSLSLESVISIEGTVRARPATMKNPDMETGEVEVLVEQLHLLNEARPLPFQHFAGKAVNEELRLRYRYLDLRRAELQRNMRLRSKVAMAVRQYLVGQRFVEVETPTLFRATPEGAREFIVPTRQKGKFYALPQSPQQYKQLLMAAGMDRYFQLARCYRDEDNRSDRQPEFTQIDLEMSFAIPEDIYNLIEGLLKGVWKEALNMDIPTPFPHMTFNEAIRRFGSDKPDTRYGLELKNVTNLFAGTTIAAFAETVAKGGKVQAMNAKGLAGLNAREYEMLEEEAMKMGAKGLAAIKIKKKWSGALANHLTPAQVEGLRNALNLQENDLLLMCASPTREVAAWSLGKVRVAVADLMQQKGTLKLPADQYNFLWVDDFPLFDVDEETGGLVSNHHPFTAPLPEDVPLLKTDPAKVRGLHYDIVLNGIELGGGSIRVHDPNMQVSIMRDNLKLNPQLLARFSHLLDALAYGCPPHAGLAIGFDRLMAQLCGAPSLRDVIAFPKANSGTELMTMSPGELTEEELKFYNLRLIEKPGEGKDKKV